MNQQQKLKFFWKIINHLNKKFCKNKIEIRELKIFRDGHLHKSFPKKSGFYSRDTKRILIKEDESIVMQILILVHEFAHAYQDQILCCKGRIRHDKKGGQIYQKFLEETDKIIKFSV